MPAQIPALADTLKSLGLAILPAALADPTRDPLASVVSLGGCTGSFVSPDGLIATNHHCVQGALTYNSTPDDNLIQKGFIAHSNADDKWAGPTAHVYVASKFTDVTPQMTAGLAAMKDDLARHAALDEREKHLIADCEKDRPELRCRVASTFGGGRYDLIEQLDIRDVRLVYAPPRAVGNFGGEVDNWMWPRHTADFSFYRAYVAADGRPAEHNPGNVPFHPTHYLSVAKTPLVSGDLVLVAGYPGVTRRLATADQTEEAASWLFPRTIELNHQWLDVLETVGKDHPDLRIKSEPRRRSLANFMKKDTGVVKTLVDEGVLQQRKAEEAKLAAWVAADPARKAKFGPALERIAALDAEKRKTREADAALADLIRGSSLLEQAMTIVRVADERPRPDRERRAEYQQRNWSRLVSATVALKKTYAREIDRAVLRMMISRAQALPAAERPPALAKILGGKSVDAALDRLFAHPSIEDTALRKKLMETATMATLRGSDDPLIRLAIALRPEVKAADARADGYQGGMAVAMPLYVESRQELAGAPLAPDANGTLRITFGHVMPSPKGGRSFTTLSELAAKATGEEPFDAPAALLDAIKAKAGSAYVSAEVGEVPVDFMSDVDITNGNSGSATMNRRGELVGLAFDGTLDTVASDWLYLRNVTRTIHVDVRYMLWYLDVVEGAQRLLVELRAKPAR